MDEQQFRSATGQTGTDAYQYEATGIANALRDLNARQSRLIDVILRELSDDASVNFSIASERFPDACITADGDGLRRLLNLQRQASDAKYVSEIVRGISNPTVVVKDPLD
jgi:hypothetical protein